MAKKTTDKTLNKTARLAGVLYFLFLIAGIFSFFYVPSKIFVAGNAAATAANLLANELLFRLGIASNIFGQIIFIFLALLLYDLFKGVNKSQSRLMVALVISSVPITFVVILFQVLSLICLSGADFLNAFSLTQLQSLALFFMTAYNYGIIVVGIFWGLWLFPFGYLTYKSGFLPKLLGVLLVLGCLGYLADSLCFILFPAYYPLVTQLSTIPASLGEIGMIFWLLFKRVS